MPYCTQCGHAARDVDVFCAHCGARQHPAEEAARPEDGSHAAPPPGAPVDPLAGLSPRTAAILCYVPAIGWIAAVIVLAARKYKDDRLLRFHAFQGLYLFAAWLVVDWVIGPMAQADSVRHFPIETVLHGPILGASIFMMVKASHGEPYALPIVGELAQRSATEQ